MRGEARIGDDRAAARRGAAKAVAEPPAACRFAPSPHGTWITLREDGFLASRRPRTAMRNGRWSSVGSTPT